MVGVDHRVSHSTTPGWCQLHQKNSRWRYGAWAGALVFAAMACISLLSALPTTAVTPDAVNRVRPSVQQVMPQGWAFFTRSMNQPDVSAYSGDLDHQITTTNSDYRNALGISREQRADGPELADLARAVPDAAWVDCAAYVADIRGCAANRHNAVPLSNAVGHPSTCGSVALVKSAPVPWAWAAEHSRGRRVSQIAWIEVHCANHARGR